jgi:hypothetical protein
MGYDVEYYFQQYFSYIAAASVNLVKPTGIPQVTDKRCHIVNNLDFGSRRGRDRMVLGFTTTYAITA